MVTALIAGTTSALGGDGAAASTAAKIEMGNNWALSLQASGHASAFVGGGYGVAWNVAYDESMVLDWLDPFRPFSNKFTWNKEVGIDSFPNVGAGLSFVYTNANKVEQLYYDSVQATLGAGRHVYIIGTSGDNYNGWGAGITLSTPSYFSVVSGVISYADPFEFKDIFNWIKRKIN